MYKSSRFAAILGLAAITGTGAAFIRARHTDHPQVHDKLLDLPSSFLRIQPGMSKDQVVTLVGTPPQKQMNAKFEHKTAAEWEQLRQEVDADAKVRSDPEAPPDPAMIKRSLTLEHRTKELWTYLPNTSVYVLLAFDGDGKLIKMRSDRISNNKITGPPSK
ncbi:hypothetical protein [Capsulimonas corticalis]|nr:hypothetical protein [Capsulimonas corticalis]